MSQDASHQSRRTALIFWVMTLLFIAQMIWWIVFQFVHGRDELRLIERTLRYERYAGVELWREHIDHWTDSLRQSWSRLPHNALRSAHVSYLTGWTDVVFDGPDGRELIGRRRSDTIVTIGRMTVPTTDGQVTIFLSSAAFTECITPELPDVRFRPVADTSIAARDAVTAAHLSVDPAALERALDNRRRRTRMFAAEGTFFMLLILIGAFSIHRALRRTEEFERRQQNFLAAVTHELKAPLASIRLFVETLATRELPEPKRGEVLGKITEDVERLQDLVDDTLDACVFARRSFQSRLETNQLSRDLLAYAAMYRPRAERAGLQLITEIEPDLTARTDYHQLRRAVGAVIDNAIKYSKPGHSRNTVRVSLTADSSDAIIIVQDQGVGLNPAEQNRVFERFYRAGDEMTRNVSGSGLGLYLAREIIAAHNGRISLRSDGPGAGTTVEIRLPLDTPTEAAT